MEAWMFWLIAALVVLGAEILSGTFYLMMISFGLFAAAIAAFCGLDLNMQSIIAAVVWIGSTLILNKTRLGKRGRVHSEKDPNVNIDIGQTVKVDAWTTENTARASYRGAMWDVELIRNEKTGEATPGTFVIREVRASRLYVEKIN